MLSGNDLKIGVLFDMSTTETTIVVFPAQNEWMLYYLWANVLIAQFLHTAYMGLLTNWDPVVCFGESDLIWKYPIYH